MANLTVIRWRDIPAQVIAGQGRDRVRRELSPRFQIAIDRAAMAAGLIGTDTYLEQWTRTSRECGDDLETEVATEVDRLETEFDPERIDRIVALGGTEDQ
jgi:hypothetical protein